MTSQLLLPWMSMALAGVGTSAPPPGMAEAGAPQRVALVVGLDRYTADLTLQDLRFAAADARAVGDLLADQGYRVHRLADQASRIDFLEALDNATADLQRDDLFLLYFAGHAQLEPGGDQLDLQLLFSDDNGASGEGLPIEDLSDRIDGLATSRRVVMLDTCYSDRTQQMLARLRGSPTVQSPAVGRFDAWIFSAAPQQSAQEDAALGHGVFTHYLLEALSGTADANGDGAVGVLEVYNWVGFKTAEHTGRAQVPWIEESRVGWEDLPLVTLDTLGEPVAALPWYDQIFPGAKVWIDGMTRGPGSVAPGPHDVEVRDGSGAVVLKRRLVVGEGEVLDARDWVDAASAQLRVGAGLGWTASQDRVPAVAGQVAGWWLPAAPSALRPGFGGMVSAGRGRIADEVQVDGGVALARAGGFWQATPWLSVGPSVGAGAVWRVVPAGSQWAPVGELGVHSAIHRGPMWLGVDLGARAWPVDGGVVVHPAGSLTVGAQL